MAFTHNIRRVYIKVRCIEYFAESNRATQNFSLRISKGALAQLAAYVLKPDGNGGDQAKIGHVPSQTKLACDVE